MAKKQEKNIMKEDDFAKKQTSLVSDAQKEVEKVQNVDNNDIFSNDNSIVDKKLVTSILKEEKKELKRAKKLEKQITKEKKKKRRKRISELLKNKKEEEKKARKSQEEALKEYEKKDC